MIDSCKNELEELEGHGEYDNKCGGYWYCESDKNEIDEVSDFLSNLKFTLRIAESYNVNL